MKFNILLLALTFSATAGTIPDSLKGSWKVTRVETDPKNTSRSQVPVGKIEGAILTFTESRVSMTDLDCLDPVAELKAEEIHLTCKKSKASLPNTNDGLLFTEKSAKLRKNGEMVVTLHADGVYYARRTTAEDIPKPSFDCKKASAPSEKTICARLDLAFLDEQMAKVYKQAVDSAKEWGDEGRCLKAVKRAHSAWLKKRNACKDKVECLENTLKEQIELESDQLNNWLTKDCSFG